MADTTRTLSRRSLLGGLAAAGAALLSAGCGGAGPGLTGATASGALSIATSAGSSPSAASSGAATSGAATSSAATSSAAATSAATGAAATATSATPSAAPAAGAAAAKGTFNWWPGWPGTYMRDIADVFMKANPAVKVETGLFYPDNTKLLSTLAAGTGPDVVSDIGYYNFIQRGLVLPIDDLLKADKIATTNGDIRESNWNAFRWKGKYYGVPAVDTAGREAMGYNVDLVQQAGLDPEKLPETWDDVYLWHQKLTKVDAGGQVQTLGMDPLFSRANATSDGDTWLWPEMWGFHYFDLNGLKYDIDRPETIEIYTTIQKFYDLVGVDKQAAFQKTITTSYGAFGVGKQAMGITYPSGPARVHQTNPNGTYKWGWVPMPAARKGITLQTAAGHAQLLMQGTKQVDTGFKLALFMTQKQACDILFDQVGWVGPSKAWQQTMDLSKFPAHVQQGIRFFTTSIDQAKEVWTPALDPEDEDLGTEWRKVAGTVNHHTVDPKTAAQQLQFTMTTQLNSQKGDFKAG